VRASEFDFDLPAELIAQQPAARREDARLLVLDRCSGAVAHHGVTDLPGLLRSGDLLVVNDTRVLAARLFGYRDTGGKVEALLLEPAPAHGDDAWVAMVKAGGTLREGESVRVETRDGGAGGAYRIVRRLGGGRFAVVGDDVPLAELMASAGKLPLPPYIRREIHDERDVLDRERYQTIFAEHDGAIAAPTAGLHLTPEIVDRLAARSVDVARVTLHVGVGTFLPIRTDDLDEHDMHEERYVVPDETAAAIRAARAEGRRVVAVGTTTVRTLEAAAAASDDGLPVASAGSTDLFIRPGHTFRAVDALLTNFHLPRSTLLCLVSALAGRERVLAAYREAVAERYRFFSYGDAMLIV
jgi:S-adenosylmethionine:tRNA ribosyltransferase-isomerase